MKDKVESFEKQRVRSSYISVVVSTSLVLFMLGVIGILAMSGDTLSRYVKENFFITVTVKDKVKQADTDKLEKYLALLPSVRHTEFISKEEATRKLKEDIGEEFIDFIGYNPLSDKIQISLNSAYVNNDSLRLLQGELAKINEVASVDYDSLTLDEMNENINKISLWLGCVAALFLIVSVMLINSSIRLMIYSKRFTIRTMQMVGATKFFISRPFLVRSMLNAFLGALLAIAFVSGIVYYLWEYQGEFRSVFDFRVIGAMYLAMILVSMLITFVSTSLSLRKFLKMKTEDMYY